jgi:hypothetical protein
MTLSDLATAIESERARLYFKNNSGVEAVVSATERVGHNSQFDRAVMAPYVPAIARARSPDGDLFERIPECIFEADAGFMSSDYNGAFNDLRFHRSSRGLVVALPIAMHLSATSGVTCRVAAGCREETDHLN